MIHKYKCYLSIFSLMVAFLLCICNTNTALSQNLTQEPEVNQIFRPIAEITDPNSIEMLLFEFIVTEEADDVERIEIIDITNNGFGPDDVMVVYPSTNVYTLDQPGSEVAEIMRNWSFEEQRRDGLNLSPDYFYPEEADSVDISELEASEMEIVQNAMIADVLETLNRNYRDMPISLRLERDEEGFTFQMWNYNRDAFSFSPRPPATPDSIAIHDLMYVHYSDSTIVADTTLYDLIYINHTIEDIVYIPGKKDEVRPFNRTGLPVRQSRTLPSDSAIRNQ